MQINKDRLLFAASKAGISNEQAENLWSILKESPEEKAPASTFDLAHVLYYIGALIVISSLGWLLGLGWESFGGGGILTIALIYIAIFLFVGNALWRRKDLKIPGGLFITMAVCLIPLAVYGFEVYTGIWVSDEPGKYSDFFSWIKGGWFLMEIATVIGGCIALYYFPFPFLTAPIFYALWFMSMDITPLLFGGEAFSGEGPIWVSMFFGLAILIAAYFIDQRTEQDFAFWGYFFGMLAFWISLFVLGTTELRLFIIFLINCFLILLSVLLQRRVFLIFGAIGIYWYLSHLSYTFFSDSILFPFILSLLGILIVFLGIVYSRHQEKIEQTILRSLPEEIIKLLPKSRN